MIASMVLLLLCINVCINECINLLTVAINDVAAYLKLESGLILAASSPKAGGGKMRTLF